MCGLAQIDETGIVGKHTMTQQQFNITDKTDAENEAAKAVAQARPENVARLNASTTSVAADQATETEAQFTLEDSCRSVEVEKMIAEMRSEVLSNRKRNMIWLMGAVAMCLPFFYLDRLTDFIAFLSPDAPQKLFQFQHVGIALIITHVLLIIPMRERRRRNQRFARLFERSMERSGMPRELEEISDLRLVGPLTEVLSIDSVPVRNMAKAQLTRLLPLLKASDAHLLNAPQRRQLNHFVSPRLYEIGYRDIRELWSKRVRRRDTDFQLAILTAYEQVGSADCLPAVQSLAQPTPVYVKIVPPDVVESARRCLTFITTISEQDRASKQLLRASSAMEVMPDMLLRATNHQTAKDEAPDTLLRAAAPIDDPVVTEKKV